MTTEELMAHQNATMAKMMDSVLEPPMENSAVLLMLAEIVGIKERLDALERLSQQHGK